MKRQRFGKALSMVTVAALVTAITGSASGGDLKEIRGRGVLRHLGVPYANFVSGSGDGMDVELTRLFSGSIGVRYEYVRTGWGTVIQDLTGKKVKVSGNDIDILEDAPIKGDVIANGLTLLPWREKVVAFSEPTFPNQIWLIARADSKVKPIRPTKNVEKDIALTKSLMKGRKVLAMEKTCLDPKLYNLAETGADVVLFNGQLNELAPAVLNNEAEMTILDVPDALVALDKWTGKIKIIGPISPKQVMGTAFPKDAPGLLAAYNDFLRQAKRDGRYMALINKYYPSVTAYFPGFFRGMK